MAEYQRKTRDVWMVQGDYGQGWETLCEEETRADAKEQLRCYDVNERQYPHRIKKRLERIQAHGAGADDAPAGSGIAWREEEREWNGC